jgi:TDG/mug DNA glycosylase family protein
MRFSPEELLAAHGKTLPDLIAPHLSILFCGINPGLYSAAAGYHFARPGNRFWTTLHGAGITRSVLKPSEGVALLEDHCGITDLVVRSTSRAAELSADELMAGRRSLVRKVNRYTPRFLAILGIGAYRVAFEKPDAALGRQPEQLGSTVVWVLPNPSGLNAHYPPTRLIQQFRCLRDAILA